MKTNWQTKKLSDVSFFQEGPGIRKYEYKKNGYPIINVRCVQDGYIDLSNAQAVDPKFIKEKWAHFQVEEGDILFTTSGTIGRTAMATKDDLPLLMNTSVVRFKSLNEKELDRYFLAWLLRSPKFIEEVKSYSSGTAQKNVGPTHLKLISISYPPILEQKRIVKILDEAFEKIETAKENAEKNLHNSKELFESYLENVFTNPEKDWEKKTLSEICEKLFAGGDVPKKNLSKERTEKYNVPIYANGFKDKGLYGYTDIKKVTKPSITVSARGTIGYAEVREEPFFPVVRLIVLTPNSTVDLHFLYYITHNFKFSNTGTSIPQLTIPMIENIKIPVPSISEQKDIVKKIKQLLEQTKKLEEVYKKKLVDLEELKKSVLNKAFTEEL